MKHRNDGFILPENSSKARLADAGLLSAATGKFQNGKAASCSSGSEHSRSRHNRDRSHIQQLPHTDNVPLLGTAFFRGDSRVDSGRISSPSNLPGRTPTYESRGCEMAAANRAPRSRQVRSGWILVQLSQRPTNGVELPETASSTVEGEPASGQQN